jgi:hypothetical protein
MADWVRASLQLRGKIRRFVQSSVLPGNTERLLANRRGECDRCGECCKILFKCPFLGTDEQGQYTCKIYAYRFSQCRLYPLQASDLREVNHCSYTFVEEPAMALPGATPTPQPLD